MAMSRELALNHVDSTVALALALMFLLMDTVIANWSQKVATQTRIP